MLDREDTKTKTCKMKNNVIKRGKSWSFVVEISRDPVSNKRRQKWYSGYRTKDEAIQARRRVLTELDTGRFVEESRLTMRDFMEEWLVAVKPTVRESTWETYSLLVRVHIVPRLGHVRVQRLTPAALNGFYAALQTEGRIDQRTVQRKRFVKDSCDIEEPKNEKRGLSAKTVKNVHVLIHAALDYALVHNLVQKNVASVAEAPRPARFGDRVSLHVSSRW
jgi:hypothetical protein